MVEKKAQWIFFLNSLPIMLVCSRFLICAAQTQSQSPQTLTERIIGAPGGVRDSEVQEVWPFPSTRQHAVTGNISIPPRRGRGDGGVGKI